MWSCCSFGWAATAGPNRSWQRRGTRGGTQQRGGERSQLAGSGQSWHRPGSPSSASWQVSSWRSFASPGNHTNKIQPRTLCTVALHCSRPDLVCGRWGITLHRITCIYDICLSRRAPDQQEYGYSTTTGTKSRSRCMVAIEQTCDERAVVCWT
jgi:hypothetical protein